MSVACKHFSLQLRTSLRRNETPTIVQWVKLVAVVYHCKDGTFDVLNYSYLEAWAVDQGAVSPPYDYFDFNFYHELDCTSGVAIWGR